MDDSKIRHIKEALLQCARENRDIPYATFRINISRLCEDAELRIRELEDTLRTYIYKVPNEMSFDDFEEVCINQLGGNE